MGNNFQQYAWSTGERNINPEASEFPVQNSIYISPTYNLTSNLVDSRLTKTDADRYTDWQQKKTPLTSAVSAFEIYD